MLDNKIYFLYCIVFFAGGFNIVSSEFFADVLNQHIKKTLLA